MQPVQAVDHDPDRGVEADAVLGHGEVVVHGLGAADHGRSLGGEPPGDAQGVVTTDGDERVEAGVLDGAQALLDAAVDLHRVGARAAENGPADVEDALEGALVEVGEVAVAEQALPAVAHLHHASPAGVGHRADGADGGVETGGVAPAGENADPHLLTSACSSRPDRGRQRYRMAPAVAPKSPARSPVSGARRAARETAPGRGRSR